jgi:hypothetical protein
MKKAGRRFDSATRPWRRVADGGAGRSGDDSGETEEEEGLGGPVMGWKAKTSWASMNFFKENGPGFKYSLGRNGNWVAENLFLFFFKAFGCK